MSRNLEVKIKELALREKKLAIQRERLEFQKSKLNIKKGNIIRNLGNAFLEYSWGEDNSWRTPHNLSLLEKQLKERL